MEALNEEIITKIDKRASFFVTKYELIILTNCFNLCRKG